MASTWTEEQGKTYDKVSVEALKLSTFVLGSAALFKFDSDEYWNYIAKNVGDGKTVKDCKDYRDEINKDVDEGELSSTWTKEEVTKCIAAFVKVAGSGSFEFGTYEFWECVAKEVDSGKTWKECREQYVKGFGVPKKHDRSKNMKSDDDKK